MFISENERNKEMYNRFVKMDWQAPGVKDDFKQKLADSSVDHYCVYNRNNQISVRVLLTFNPAGTWRLYNVPLTSMQRHDVASILIRRYIQNI